MSEMVDRVAQALLENGDPKQKPATPWLATREREREYWRNHARAAIAAMREPTPQMICVGDTHAEGVTEKVWDAMIDEALA